MLELGNAFSSWIKSKRSGSACLAVAVALTLVVTVAACGGSQTDGAGGGSDSGDDPIVIGATMAITGNLSGLDLPSLNAAKIAIEDVNKAGGVMGRELKLITSDNKSDLTQVGAAAMRAVEDGAQIIIPTSDYNYGIPAVRVATENDLLSIGVGAAPQYGRTGAGPLFFSVEQGSNVEGAAMAEFAFEEKGWRNAYILSDTSIDYSRQLCEFFDESWTDRGGNIVGRDTFSNDDNSIAAQVNRLRGTDDVDFVALCSYLPGAATAVNQIRSAGVDFPLVGGIAYDIEAFLESVPDLNDFYNLSVGSLSGDDGDEDRARLGDEFREQFGVPDTAYGVIYGYSIIQLIVEAIKQADGATDGPALAAALENLGELETMQGPVSFTAECHKANTSPFGISAVENGKRAWQGYVTPAEVPTAPC